MSTQAIDITILCMCGLPASAPVHQGSGHLYNPHRGRNQIRDNQVVDDGPREGHHVISDQRVITFKQPAAGADFVATVPGAASWRVNCLAAQLTTSAVINNRVVHIVVTDGQGNTVYNFPAPNNQVAASAVLYTAGAEILSVSADNVQTLVLPPPLTLLQGWTIGFKTTLLDAGDQWANVAFYVKEWLNF